MKVKSDMISERNGESYLCFIFRSLHMDDVNISIPLRMLEVFTNSKTYYWSDKPDQISFALTTYLVLNGMILFCEI